MCLRATSSDKAPKMRIENKPLPVLLRAEVVNRMRESCELGNDIRR